jgi:hypothetical protein
LLIGSLVSSGLVRDASGYMVKSLARAILIPWMRLHGIDGLVFPGPTASVPELCQMARANHVDVFVESVPDTCGHLPHLSRLLAAPTMYELADALKYTGPIELLSMWLCIFGSAELATTDLATTLSDVDRARQIASGL